MAVGYEGDKPVNCAGADGGYPAIHNLVDNGTRVRHQRATAVARVCGPESPLAGG